MADQLNPMELLKEEMENDDIAHRINAMHRMRIIATLLGPEGIKSQLLPYLDGVIKKEDDEVLFAVAEEIGYFAPILGAQCLILLPYLENLASVEETVVRDQAVKSMIMIANQLTDAEIVNNFAPLVLKLANGEWFTSRVSAVNMIPSIYTRSGNQKIHLKQKFIELCGEETPMVRRAVAMKIGDLASCVEKDVLHELITIFKQLTGDEQDSVKMLCLDSLRQIAKVLNKDENKTHTLPVIIAATEDKSWRVRQAISKNFAQIAEALGKEITDYHLIQNFTVVLRDAEVDVRHVAINSLKSLLTMNLLSQEKLLTLIPHIQALARDSNPIVKINITHVLNITVPLVGKEIAMTKLLPNALELIEDDDSETRIEAFKIIVKFAQVIGTDIMTTLLPHIKTILTNHKWRVRIAALECVIDLALLFQNPDLFKSQLEPLFFIFVTDKACSVREVGIRRLGEIITTYKQPWLDGVLFPKILDLLKQETTYLLKSTGLYSLRAIASVMPPEYVHDKIVPPLVRLARDPVPNVRFIALKVIKGCASRIDEATKSSTIKPLLTELAGDSDKDVKFFAEEALASL